MMLKRRIETDFVMEISLTEDSKAIDLSSLKNVCVVIRKNIHDFGSMHEFKIKNNQIILQINHDEYNNLCKYIVSVIFDLENSNSETGLLRREKDYIDAFERVLTSEEENLETSVLSGDVATYPINGPSAFDLWKTRYGSDASTLDDFFAWLREPLTSLQASYSNDGVLTIKI